MIDEKKLIEDILWRVKEQVFESEEVGHNRPFCDKANVIECINNQPKICEWILCSERLPTMEECRKNDCWFILDDGNRRYQGTFDYTERYFTKFDLWNGPVEDKCVIAWQPLPEPYKPNDD